MSGNNLKTIPIMIVTLVIGFIMVTAAVMPLAADYSEGKTFVNDGFFYAKKLTSDSTDVLVWDHTDPTNIKINNVSIDTTQIDSSYDNVTLAFSEKWFIRFALSTTIIYLYEADSESSGSTGYASPSKAIDFTMTCSGGSATIVIGEDTFTETISGDGLIISAEKAEYVMKKSTTAAYVRGDSFVYGSGRTDRALGVQGTSFNAMFKASVDDGVIPIAYSPNTYTVTDSSVSYTHVQNEAFEDTYELKSYSINVTDGDNSGTITYNQIFVPSEISVENSNPATFKNIVRVVPLIALVALVAMAAGMLYLKGKE